MASRTFFAGSSIAVTDRAGAIAAAQVTSTKLPKGFSMKISAFPNLELLMNKITIFT